MKVSEKSDVHPLFFLQLLSYFLSAMRQGFYSIFTSSSPLKSLKVAKFQKMSLFKMSKKWTPKSFEILTKFRICFNIFVSITFESIPTLIIDCQCSRNETGAKFEILLLTKNQNQVQSGNFLFIWEVARIPNGVHCTTVS